MKSVFKILVVIMLSACAQKNINNYSVVQPADFANDIKQTDAYVLDVRTPQEYAEGHIANAHNLDWLNTESFKAGAKLLPKDKTLYVYCRSGRRSSEAAQYLSSLGYKVVDLDGGYLAWQNYLAH